MSEIILEDLQSLCFRCLPTRGLLSRFPSYHPIPSPHDACFALWLRAKTRCSLSSAPIGARRGSGHEAEQRCRNAAAVTLPMAQDVELTFR